MRLLSSAISAPLALAVVLSATSTRADDAPAPTPAKSTEERLADLEKRLDAVESGGAVLGKDVAIRLRPVLQADARGFLQGGTTTFLARRIRPAVEATLFGIFDLRITPEFAGAAPTVVDAYGNLKLATELQVRFGKMKGPVGIERLQSDVDLPFVERGLPTNLVPDRDVGVMLHGELFGGRIAYAGGIFDGASDGSQADGDASDHKDVEGRVFLRPFAASGPKFLKQLGFGVAGTRGEHAGALPSYKTAGQNNAFSFNADVTAGRTERRLVPQGYWYVGPLGLLGELAYVSQVVHRPGLDHYANAYAWSATASFFVTGEDASYGTVTPKHTFDPKKGTFGALELDVRFGRLRVGDTVFARGLADRTKSAQALTEVAVGAQWHFAPAIKIVVDYFHTRFENGPKGADRDAESVVIGRLQVAY
jgi:phosphate-selective porin OprO/OprP